MDQIIGIAHYLYPTCGLLRTAICSENKRERARTQMKMVHRYNLVILPRRRSYTHKDCLEAQCLNAGVTTNDHSSRQLGSSRLACCECLLLLGREAYRQELGRGIHGSYMPPRMTSTLCMCVRALFRPLYHPTEKSVADCLEAVVRVLRSSCKLADGGGVRGPPTPAVDG